MKPILFLFLSGCLLATATSHAESLGTYGRTYEIKERDAIDAMKDAANKKIAELGGTKAMGKAAVERYKATLENIVTPDGITPTKVFAVRHVDLTHVVQYTVKDDRGNIIAPAGMRINPLKFKPLTKKVFFIDARDSRQLDLVKKRATAQDKIILLAGSLFKAGKELQRSVYVDTPNLHVIMKISKMPSIASQEGDKLRVEEVVL